MSVPPSAHRCRTVGRLAAVTAAVLACPTAVAAADAGPTLRPATVRAGSTAVLEARCAAPDGTAGTVSSDVFAAPAPAVAGSSTVTVRPGTPSGDYPATLTCGAATARTTITVLGTLPAHAVPPTPAAGPAAAGSAAATSAAVADLADAGFPGPGLDPRKQGLPIAAALVFVGALIVLLRRTVRR